ncbi:MAG: hypothetical protein VX090_04955 [Pseudomonadota bacterium]|nr:hypothetical protein [Pseudomonadota bacterium]
MQPLKALVIFLGVLIFVAFGVLAYGVATKFKTSGETPTSRHFEATNVEILAGARIVETQIGGNRIILRVETPDGGMALILIDAGTGERTGVIYLKDGAAR